MILSFGRAQHLVTLPDGAQVMPAESLIKLRAGLPTWRVRSTLPPEANDIVVELCGAAHRAGWSPEQLVVAVKDACYGSDEMSQMTTTSERDALLAKVVTACIKEYFRPG